MGEHVDSAGCGCWGCISAAAGRASVCVVHAVDRGDLAVPSSGRDSRICLECQDKIQNDLREVASRWVEGQEALHPGSSGGGSERHTPRVSPPAPVRLEVVDALKVTSDRVWSLAVTVSEQVAGTRLPDDQTTPGLAEWLARSMVPRLADMQSPELVLRCYWWAVEAAEAIGEVTEGAKATVVLPDLCRALVLNEAQEQVPCHGKVEAVRDLDGRGDAVVKCTSDPRHWVPIENWQKQMAARKPRRARPRIRL